CEEERAATRRATPTRGRPSARLRRGGLDRGGAVAEYVRNMATSPRRPDAPTGGPLRRPAPRLSRDVSIRALDGTGDVVARGDVELAKDAAQMGLDGLDAQEQLGGDLGIGAAVDDEARDLDLTLGQGLDAGSVDGARPGAAVDVAAELAELA